MPWCEEEETGNEFEWVDEDENEVPADSGSSLSRIHRVATVVFLGLLGLGTVYLILQVASFFV